ncbi:MAG TPA: HNH endonuclease [Kribbellaceae bacterium]|nr:HNH endonuclease [Kribbellaceae bacterium]
MHVVRESVDRYSGRLDKAVRAIIAGDHATADTELSAISFEQPAAVKRTRPSLVELAEIYERDRYQCRYCGIRAINSAVLGLLSAAFPTQLPVHPNWKAESTHPVYLLQFVTNDHVVPVAWGGDSRDPGNIVTACWPCNAAKADLPLDALNGWRLREPGETDPDWHGLADLHAKLWHALGEPEVRGVAKQWLSINRRLYTVPGFAPR